MKKVTNSIVYGISIWEHGNISFVDGMFKPVIDWSLPTRLFWFYYNYSTDHPLIVNESHEVNDLFAVTEFGTFTGMTHMYNEELKKMMIDLK